MKPECEFCVVFDYKISRQMIEATTDPRLRQEHLDRLIHYTGIEREHYPPVDEIICRKLCGVIFKHEENRNT